ncbi:unnamed protein product [Schistosoma mattheei]|uniref:Reverse transcriptase domain-containing protein n=1 Tax=Schistosoma mattheei TaxID=31246 RepID=A0AA85B4H3_9TREM|nr:unnamed protein product [Schistosoma mattheei]
MEKAAAISNSRQLFRLVKETCVKNPTVSETISEKDRHIIHCQSRRLDRWAEHFKGQFNWPSAILRFLTISSQPECEVNVSPPTLYEVEKAIRNLKRGRAAGPDRFIPEIFKDGGPVLAMRLTEVLGRIWELDVIPSDWSQSLIVPVYKKG